MNCPFNHPTVAVVAVAIGDGVGGGRAATAAAALASLIDEELALQLSQCGDAEADALLAAVNNIASASASAAAARDNNDATALSDEELAWMLSRCDVEESRSSLSALASSPSSSSASPSSASLAFPALPGSAPRAARASESIHNTHTQTSLATRLALEVLARAFPFAATAELARAHSDAGGRIAEAAALIEARLAISPIPGALRAGATLAPRAMPRTRQGQGAGGGTSAGSAIARAIAAALDRVATGGAIASVYAAARGDAEGLARARNDAFNRATQAFLARDGASAARFSAQGRALDARMHIAQAEAATAIFEARNAGGPGGGGESYLHVGRGVEVRTRAIDLHGLHPEEAIHMASASLVAAARAAVSDAVWVAFLTGARSHSAALGRGGGSVHAAVAAHVREEGWETYEPSVGVLVVCARA